MGIDISGAGILCGHGGTEQRENCRIHPASVGRGYHGGPAVIQGVHRPVYGQQELQGIRKGRFSGGPRKYCGCWIVQCTFRRGRYHCLEGMVHTTGLAGGFDCRAFSSHLAGLAQLSQSANSASRTQLCPHGSGQRSWTRGLAKPGHRGNIQGDGWRLRRSGHANFPCHGAAMSPFSLTQLTFTSQRSLLWYFLGLQESTVSSSPRPPSPRPPP